ncbi:P-loop containing nucleoside triphosphate hydrolase protein [Hypoxylon trugodes]|uniref:P-loop containing nucleoside triphosphate hydrolase protein n=1 Tax=Hypoxylon trugodes TaxID=326681 RepID=UPI002191028C|nr:P-loop containing nucleoside triphosphate hydrolase protein [Hypoxylon trugodes]KAI1384131.1 P-loop containing nucleoside triphosphate hydrolase protein [Hypoxylon trugodes]
MADDDTLTLPTPEEIAALDEISGEPDHEHSVDNVGMKCKVKDLYEGPMTKWGDITWVEVYPENVKKVNIEDRERYALVVKYKNSNEEDDPLRIHEITVQSPLLKSFLQAVIKDDPSLSLKSAVLEEPFKDIFHHWTELKEAASEYHDEESIRHIQLLFDLLNKTINKAYDHYKDLTSKSLITFDYLWTLFKPGDILFEPGDSRPRMYRLLKTKHKTMPLIMGKVLREFKLKYLGIDTDGEKFGFQTIKVTIDDFKGIKKITDLHVYPERFMENRSHIRDQISARGRKFYSLGGIHYMLYQGTVSEDVDGRVVVDAKGYYQYTSASIRLTSLPQDDSQGSDVETTSKNGLTEEQLLICSPTVNGYSLTRKKWVQLDVSEVTDIDWNPDAFANLLLPKQYKELILAFVKTRLAQLDGFDDFVKGKGQGVIMLLAGSPGLGKTFTAESVAEEVHAPLYSVTATELGSGVYSLETSLTEALNLAARWKAVLLLDEADGFLGQRKIHETERNRSVAVFLRTLEYYKGILFMTTNQAITVDAAFGSRIDLKVNYPPLTQALQKGIWRNFIKRFPENAAFTEADLDTFTQRDINGRDIRNAVKLSSILAKSRNEALTPGHVREILKVVYDDLWETVEGEVAKEAPRSTGLQFWKHFLTNRAGRTPL